MLKKRKQIFLLSRNKNMRNTFQVAGDIDILFFNWLALYGVDATLN